MEFFTKFPVMERSELAEFRKGIDFAFRDFSRSYGEGIEAFFDPLLYFLVWIEKLMINSPWPIIIGIICGLLTAYTIARYEMKKLALTILFTKQLPFITAIIPLWLMYKNIGLLNSHLGIILAHLVITIPFGVWIMVGFIEDIPKELEESAWIDGASRTQAFWKVIVPLSTPGLVATAILCFIFSWNNFMLALVLGGFDVSTAPVSVYKYADPEAGGSGQMMAAATLVTIPVFFIVLMIQKQLASGLTVGAVKQ